MTRNHSATPVFTADLLMDFRRAVESGNYDKAHEILDPFVEQENGFALYELARLYETGRGAPADMQNAFALYLRAANAGYSRAQLEIGLFYLHGYDDVEPDESQAAAWFQRAAEIAHEPDAMAYLGMMHVEGNGVKKDVARGVSLLQQAAGAKSGGTGIAEFFLGEMYRRGAGATADARKAAKYYLAALNAAFKQKYPHPEWINEIRGLLNQMIQGGVITQREIDSVALFCRVIAIGVPRTIGGDIQE